MADVIVIAGTADGRELAASLCRRNLKVIATVTTGFGSELIGSETGMQVLEGKLAVQGMQELIKNSGARCLVDASHPFAREASLNAISACSALGVPYIRYERQKTQAAGENIIGVSNAEEAAEKACTMRGNILLTTGSNTLEVFVKAIPDFADRLFARVLPDVKVIAKCHELGLNAGNIIAMKGPFTVGMNAELIKYCKASVLITKDSGDAGGTEEKLKAAHIMSIPAIMIHRPQVPYPKVTSNMEDVLDYCLKCTGR